MARRSVQDEIKRLNTAKTIRSRRENGWRMAAAYCKPTQYAMWNAPTSVALETGVSGQEQARRLNFDGSGAACLRKYKALLERLATPYPMMWHNLVASDRSLMRISRVRNFFDELNDLMYRRRYAGKAWFRRVSLETYDQLGVYGTGPMFIGQRAITQTNREPGFSYRSIPLRDIYFLVNDENEVDTVYRSIFLNYRQYKLRFPNEAVPPCMQAEEKSGAPDEAKYYEFVHVVQPRNDYDPKAIDSRRLPFSSNYIAVADAMYIGEEGGYLSMPYITPRTVTDGSDPYGFSPAEECQAALGTASAVKKTVLKQGQKAADPVLLTNDDGVLSGVDQRPGAINPGGVDKQGRLMVQTLPTGNFQIPMEILQGEREDIKDSFFVTLFQILQDTPEMTATEVMERIAEKAALVAPTMGVLQSEMLDPMLMRELDLLVELGQVADGPNKPGLQMPPELIEAKGDFEILYTSPLAKSMNSDEVAGFLRVFDMAVNAAKNTGDNGLLDHFNLDRALPEIADFQAVPARWMNDEQTVQQRRAQRQAQQEQQTLIDNAGPLAGAAKVAAQVQSGELQ